MYAYKQNYHFLGWSRDPNASVPEYRVETDISKENGSASNAYSYILDDIVLDETCDNTPCPAGTTHVIDLYPVFEVRYILTYDVNGGTNAPVQHTAVERKAYNAEEDVYAFPSHTFTIYDDVTNNNPPVKDQYVFLGWGVAANSHLGTYGYINDANEDIARLTGGLQSTITLTPETRDTTLYAVWRAEYKLIYDANGGTGADGAAHGYATTESLGFDVSNIVPTRAGYSFLGWADTPVAPSAQYQPGDKLIVAGNGTGYTEKTLYAVWTPTGNGGA